MQRRRLLLRFIFLYVACSIALALVLGELAFHAPRISRQALTAQAMADRIGIPFENVSVTSGDGVQLRGWYARPPAFPGSVVILLHGIGDDREGMIGFAKTFLSHGYAVLMPDSRGHGASGGFPSYGINEAGDVRLWYEWARSRGAECVFGMGESMGAAILLQAARRVPFSAIVAESPFARFREIAYIRVGQFFGTSSWLGRTLLRPSVELAFLYGRLKYGVWLPDASPETSVSGIRVPVLLIHGLADTNIPFRQSELIFARNPSAVTLWKVPKAGHCGASNAAGHEFDERVLGWFAAHRCNPHHIPNL